MGTRQCFLICPIGPEPSETRRRADRLRYEIVEPVMRLFGLTTVRADEIAECVSIFDQICALLEESPIVVADLTGANPNVCYELGRRHANGGRTILMVRDVGDLPSDLIGIRSIVFDDSTVEGVVNAMLDLFRYVEQALRPRPKYVVIPRRRYVLDLSRVDDTVLLYDDGVIEAFSMLVTRPEAGEELHRDAGSSIRIYYRNDSAILYVVDIVREIVRPLRIIAGARKPIVAPTGDPPLRPMRVRHPRAALIQVAA